HAPGPAAVTAGSWRRRWWWTSAAGARRRGWTAAVTGQASGRKSTSVLTRVGQTQRIRGLAGAQARRPTSQVTPLANIKSAAKKARQAEKHRQRNVALRTRMRSA